MHLWLQTLMNTLVPSGAPSLTLGPPVLSLPDAVEAHHGWPRLVLTTNPGTGAKNPGLPRCFSGCGKSVQQAV